MIDEELVEIVSIGEAVVVVDRTEAEIVELRQVINYSGDRTDVNEILSLSANYRIRDWLTLSALSSFAWNQSNHSVFDYSVANVGGGVALTLKF